MWFCNKKKNSHTYSLASVFDSKFTSFCHSKMQLSASAMSTTHHLFSFFLQLVSRSVKKQNDKIYDKPCTVTVRLLASILDSTHISTYRQITHTQKIASTRSLKTRVDYRSHTYVYFYLVVYTIQSRRKQISFPIVHTRVFYIVFFLIFLYAPSIHGKL